MSSIKRFALFAAIISILCLSMNVQASNNYKVNMKAKTLYTLGVKFLNGVEVKQDLTQARTWFEKAAEQGHYNAKLQLIKLQN